MKTNRHCLMHERLSVRMNKLSISARNGLLGNISSHGVFFSFFCICAKGRGVTDSILGFQVLIFDATMWSFIDSTAAREILQIVDKFKALGVAVLLAGASCKFFGLCMSRCLQPFSRVSAQGLLGFY